MSGVGRKSSFSDSEYKRLINYRERPVNDLDCLSVEVASFAVVRRN